MRFDEEKIAGMLQNMLSADLTDKEKGPIKFALKANDHWHIVNEDRRLPENRLIYCERA